MVSIILAKRYVCRVPGQATSPRTRCAAGEVLVAHRGGSQGRGFRFFGTIPTDLKTESLRTCLGFAGRRVYEVVVGMSVKEQKYFLDFHARQNLGCQARMPYPEHD